MVDTFLDINGAKKIVKRRIIEYLSSDKMIHSKYSKIYAWANENIDTYLNLVDLSDKENALSVLASGDQVFNLIYRGINNIDTFDTNKLTEYYALGLKRAMILKYNYENFISNMKKLCSGSITSIEEVYSIIESLYQYMNKKYKLFWKNLIDYDFELRKVYKSDHNLVDLMIFNDYINHSLLYNTYLHSEDDYNKLKERIGNANITFKNANAKDLDKEFKGNKYDLILLSNILDYFRYIFSDLWGYKDLKEYEDKLETIANKDAIIFLKYVFYYQGLDDLNPPERSARIFRDSSFNLSELIDEIIIPFNKSKYDRSKDAIVLKRVK